jgi:hypothetical protein
MRMSVLGAGLVVLAGCTTPEMPAMNADGSLQQESTIYQRDVPRPPALRAPRQSSATGWPDLGYRPGGYPLN